MVAAETARAYLELRGTQRQLQIAQTTLEEQRQTLTVTEDKHRNGLASDLEVLRARTEVESTAAEIPPLQQAIRQYIHVLSTLLGLEPTALSAELEQPAPIPAVPGQLAVGIPSDLLRRRPDIQAAERQLAAATAQVWAWRRRSCSRRWSSAASAGLASRNFGDLFNGNSTTTPAATTSPARPSTGRCSTPGVARRASSSPRRSVDAAKAAYQDTVLRAFREVESSLVAVDRAQARVGDLKRLSASARESAGDRPARLRAGHSRPTDGARRPAPVEPRRHAAGAGRGVSSWSTSVTLYKALGGGWEVAEPAAGDTAGRSTPANHNEGNMP